jgi:hypothetical protein
MKCKTCGHEIETKTIVIDKTKYELEQHDNGIKFGDIKIPKGWRLLKPWEAQRLWDLGYLRNNWFFVENTCKEEKKKGNVAWFDANSDWATLCCNGGRACADVSLGVVLCRDVEGCK